MLVIREEQMAVFEAALQERFKNEAAARLAKRYGRACDEMQRLVRRGADKAARYGITTDRGITLLLEWIIEEGEDFDVDPTRPVAAEILNADLPEAAKLHSLAESRPWTGRGSAMVEDCG